MSHNTDAFGCIFCQMVYGRTVRDIVDIWMLYVGVDICGLYLVEYSDLLLLLLLQRKIQHVIQIRLYVTVHNTYYIPIVHPVLILCVLRLLQYLQ